MRILQVSGAYPPATAYTGPPASLHRMCQELIDRGTDVRVVTTDADLERRSGAATGRWTEHEGVPVFYGRRIGRRGTFSPAFLGEVLRASGTADLVHVTAVFGWALPSAALACRRRGLPLVLSPRGSFAADALAWRSAKKSLFDAFGGRAALRTVSAFHATTAQEEADVRRLFPRAAVGCVPNGVEIPDGDSLQRLREGSDARFLLYLGRLHRHKNLDLLLRAFARCAPACPDLTLLLVGPDYDQITPSLRRLAQELSIDRRIRFLGRRDGSEKAALLARATALVLPSKSENFGNAVAEALAHGTPVITTTGTPWQEVALRGCGWWVEPIESALATALDAAAALGPEERMARGERGRAWVREAFAWPALAERMRAFYAGVIERAGARRRGSPEAGC